MVFAAISQVTQGHLYITIIDALTAPDIRSWLCQPAPGSQLPIPGPQMDSDLQLRFRGASHAYPWVWSRRRWFPAPCPPQSPWRWPWLWFREWPRGTPRGGMRGEEKPRMSPWYCPNHGFISDDLCVCSRGQRQPRVHHQHGCLHEVRQTLPKLQQWQCSLHNDNVLLPLSISLYLIFYVIFRCCTDYKILSNNSVLLLLSWLGVWLLRGDTVTRAPTPETEELLSVCFGLWRDLGESEAWSV